MHRKVFTTIAGLVVLSILSTGVAFARSDIPEKPVSPEITYLRNQSNQQGPRLGQNSGPGLGGDDQVHTQAIALGKPGTVFSFSKTFGTTQQAYYDEGLINGAPGIAIDGDDNVYAVEENGARLLKWNSSGVLQWKHGTAGLHDWGTNDLGWPRDVVIGPDGKVWVADNDMVARFEAENGNIINRFPAEPWNSPDENRFGELRGIAFDHAGHLYLADRWRQRVQVYSIGGGTPVYQATIGITDQRVDPTNMNGFNEPGQMVVDSANNLYIDDMQNARVQKCAPNGTFDAWTCSTLHGGTWGNGANEMYFPSGLGIDASDAVYLTDNGNGRVYKCTGAVCNVFASEMNWPSDVVIASDGTVLISAYHDWTIRKYSTAGVAQGIFAGVTGIPYNTSDNNFNGPRALDVDALGNVYLAEEWGQRMFKLSPTGSILWKDGEAGLAGNDPSHLNSPNALAVNATRTKLIVVGGGSRVAWINPVNGAPLVPPLNFKGDWGDGQYEFKQALGVAFDPAGNFYISDRENQRVMMYNPLGVFVRQLGVTDNRGPANDHFSSPAGITTDKLGNLYVADQDNCRVQKFDKLGKFLMTFGTALCGWQIDRMGRPADVAVDASGRVYVAEESNQRVNVFSPVGAYLATIAGNSGGNTGDLRAPVSVAVDPKGNVYVGDQNNSRIQKYSLNVPFAAKLSLDGFAQRETPSIWSVAYFKNQIYAGTWASNGGAAQIWRKGAYGWEKLMSDGFDDGANQAIDHLFVYKNYLYASTMNCFGENCSQSNGGQLWRSPDGMTWLPVILDGFGDSNNAEIFRMAILSGKLCASTWANVGHGSEIWCSVSGDPSTWVREVSAGINNPNNDAILSMIEFGGAQFAGTANSITGGEIYRRVGAGGWTQINTTTFNDPGVSAITAFASFKTYLYVATNHNEGAGMQVWRCKLCTGSDWQEVEANGFGNINNRRMSSLVATPTAMYAAVGNMDTGLEIWKTVDGLHWIQVSVDGLGSSSNNRFYWNNDLIAVGSTLYLGTINQANGGAVWKICTTKACY